MHASAADAHVNAVADRMRQPDLCTAITIDNYVLCVIYTV